MHALVGGTPGSRRRLVRKTWVAGCGGFEPVQTGDCGHLFQHLMRGRSLPSVKWAFNESFFEDLLPACALKPAQNAMGDGRQSKV
jgi:hypothetical protein